MPTILEGLGMSLEARHDERIGGVGEERAAVTASPALAAGDRLGAGLGGCPDRAGLAPLPGGAGLSRAVDAAEPGANPSGDSSPSRADESITQRLKEALALIDIKVRPFGNQQNWLYVACSTRFAVALLLSTCPGGGC